MVARAASHVPIRYLAGAAEHDGPSGNQELVRRLERASDEAVEERHRHANVRAGS